MVRPSLLLAALLLVMAGCAQRPNDTPVTPPPSDVPRTFAQDVAFLEQYGPVQLLEDPGGARVLLSARYQGRVMTSAVAPDSSSLGWIHHDFIASGQTGTQFDNYGGEDRFWLGPEGGQFGLYFPPGSPFSFDAWQVPAALHEGAWNVAAASPTSVTYTRAMQLTNYSGTRFDLAVERTVRLLTKQDVASQLGVELPDGVAWVGYETVNRVTNTDTTAWTQASGLPSIWILGMFEPFDTTYVVLPFEGPADSSVVNTRYFGPIPPDRLALRDGYLVFLCDGRYRSKIGIGPAHARPVAGSYTPSQRLLTLVQYTLPEDRLDYVNSMWEHQQAPYEGDVVNSYNDGPPAPGVPPLGGFYELESSSPALDLAPGESYAHTHRTLHLVGAPAALDAVARGTLGVSLEAIPEALRR